MGYWSLRLCVWLASAKGTPAPVLSLASCALAYPGEPDGKDAGLMLLRDMTVKGTKHDLLEKVTLEIPGQPAVVPREKVLKPAAYWVPRQWHEVIDRLRAHGIPMETIQEDKELAVEMYRVHEPKVSNEPFEGRVNAIGSPVVERRIEKFLAGSVRVPVSAPFGDLICALLEPASEDSFFSWGFFLEIIQTTEYVEAYVMEPMAEKMLGEVPALAREFEDKRKSDDHFRNNPKVRLQWFYQRTPFYDDRAGLYPVAREVKAK